MSTIFSTLILVVGKYGQDYRIDIGVIFISNSGGITTTCGGRISNDRV